MIDNIREICEYKVNSNLSPRRRSTRHRGQRRRGDREPASPGTALRANCWPA